MSKTCQANNFLKDLSDFPELRAKAANSIAVCTWLAVVTHDTAGDSAHAATRAAVLYGFMEAIIVMCLVALRIVIAGVHVCAFARVPRAVCALCVCMCACACARARMCVCACACACAPACARVCL